MKNYKKGILCGMVLSTMSLMADDDGIIKVNTFDDIEGSGKCSLRSAIYAADYDVAKDGCKAGRGKGRIDRIQLEEGVYTLTKGALKPKTEIMIAGASRFDYSVKDPLTNKYPSLTPIKTTISAESNSHIFDTSISRSTLTLSHLKLIKGEATDGQLGGALRLGGNTTIVNSEIAESSSVAGGGAIYLAGTTSQYVTNIIGTSLYRNKSSNGSSILAMACFDGQEPASYAITIDQSSLVDNVSPDSPNAIQLCGVTQFNLSSSTVAKNTTSVEEGSIIEAIAFGNSNKFKDTSVSKLNNGLFTGSEINMTGNTIVENTTLNTFIYDESLPISFNLNVLAFNDVNNKSCAVNTESSEDKSKIIVLNNAGSIQDCDLLNTENIEKNLDIGGNNRTDYLYEISDIPTPYNQYKAIYFPKKSLMESNLIDVAPREACSGIYDQRGLLRSSALSSSLSDRENKCDIGAVEINNELIAPDLTSIKNTSILDLIQNYKQQIKILNAWLKDPRIDKTQIKMYEEEIKYFENLLDYLENKVNQKFRAIYIDPFEKAISGEVLVTVENRPNADQVGYSLLSLDADKFDVHRRVIGIGQYSNEDIKQILESEDNDTSTNSDLHCDWIPSIERIVMYRTSGQLTEAGNEAVCVYTIQEKNNPQNSSTGIIRAQFVNINPVAINDEIQLDPSQNLVVKVDPLRNDNDSGDGPRDESNYDQIYHTNGRGQAIPIRFTRIPSGLSIDAERKGLCPGEKSEECYGGIITFTIQNNLSQFDYPVGYVIYDAEGAESNGATILLKNVAKNTNSESSGGGSISVFNLFGLLGITAYRSRRLFRK